MKELKVIIAGEGKAPTRAHVIKAAQAAELSADETEKLIDEILDCADDTVFRTLAKALPIRRKTIESVARSMEENRQRLTLAKQKK